MMTDGVEDPVEFALLCLNGIHRVRGSYGAVEEGNTDVSDESDSL